MENTAVENNAVEPAQAEPNEPAEKLFTQEEVDKIVSERLARQEKQTNKKIEEAQKLAQMNEAEKAAYELEELKKKVAAYEKAENRNSMLKIARGMVSDEGIQISEELLGLLVSDDADTTKTAVKGFTDLFKAEVEKKVRETLKGTSPKAGSGTGLTKEQIMAIKDRRVRQEKIAENIDLFR